MRGWNIVFWDGLLVAACLLLPPPWGAQAQPLRATEQRQLQSTRFYGDRWNYDTTKLREDGFVDYGPKDWGSIVCNEDTVEGLEACLAYTDKWHTSQGWSIRDNYCRWCPADTPGLCGSHHMSPINLERSRGLGFWEKTEELNNGDPGEGAHPNAQECLDEHWMKVSTRQWRS